MPKVLEKSITDILTNQSKIFSIFSELVTVTDKQKSLLVKLDNPISLANSTYEKIIVDLSPLSSMGIDGNLTFSRASNTSSKGISYFLEMPGISVADSDIQKSSVFLSCADGNSLTDFIVFTNGYKTPLIDTDLSNYYTKTEVDNAIEEVNNNVSSKSSVSVSSTGTATDEVSYITVDGVEKKIGGGGTKLYRHAVYVGNYYYVVFITTDSRNLYSDLNKISLYNYFGSNYSNVINFVNFYDYDKYPHKTGIIVGFRDSAGFLVYNSSNGSFSWDNINSDPCTKDIVTEL